MNIRNNLPLQEKLASEYVLGTLKGGARRRFETWLRDNAALRRSVAEWQDRLHPLAGFSAPAQPPAHIWRAIDKQLGFSNKQNQAALEQPRGMPDKSSFRAGLRESLNFWRSLGLASSAVAALLVAVLLINPGGTSAPTASYVAMLADDKAQAVALVTGDASKHTLTVKVLTSQTLPADRSLELWAVPKEGPPRSLGLVAANGSISLPFPDNATPQSIPLLAVSLEPKGGSPNPNGPTGPILFKGAWVQI